MTAPESAPAAVASAPDRHDRGVPRRYGDMRYGMSLVAVVVGTYALVTAPIGQIAQIILSRQLDLVPLILGQIVFAAAVALFGVLVAPTSGARRGIAAAIVAAAVLISSIVLPLQYTGALRLPPVASYLLGPAFLATLAVSAAWLLIRERRGVAFAFLLAALVVPFALYGILLAGAPSAVTVPVQNVLVTIIGVGIAWAGWAVSRGVAPAHPRP